jgi:hypothetical protein
LTLPLIETPLESTFPDLAGADAPLGCGTGTTGGGVGGVEGCGSGLRVENIFTGKFLQAAQMKLILFRAPQRIQNLWKYA